MNRVLPTLIIVCVLGSLLFTSATGISPTLADPGILHVAPGANCGGASPCYGDIQSAINDASDQDEIRVAQGTYSQLSTGGGVTAVAWIINKKISLLGGYTISDWNTANPETNLTVIDPQDNGIGIYIRYLLDQSLGNVTINGFTITDGNATESTAGTDSGGGVYINKTAHLVVTIQNCEIYSNAAEDGSGGGIKSFSSDNLHLIGNHIYENQGSGVSMSSGSNPTFISNVINDNVGDGIGVFTAPGTKTDIRDNEITGNQGSGVTLLSVSGGSLTGNLVTDNHPTGGGGGFDITGAIGNFEISDNILSGNTALQGGGIDISGSIARVINNVIHSNSTTPSSNGGGGIYVNSGSSGSYTMVSGNLVYSNTTSHQGGGILALGYVDVLGNAVTGNSAYSGGGIVATVTGIIGNNLISGNTARIGGGIYAINPMGLVLEQNRVFNNRATTGEGGGIYVWGNGFFPMIFSLDGNQVISNTASTKGGGIYLECPNG